MAEDLEQSRTRLTRANRQLEEQYQALIAKNHYVQAILENITAGVVSLDRAGRITTMNRAAEAILGLEAGALLGESALDLMGPAHRGLVQEVSQLLKSSPGSQWQRRLDLEVRGETVKLLVNAVALMDSEGGDSGIVAVFENISELEKMQRLDAWKEVARRIAHEIKNPLTPIKLSAERLERKFGPMVTDPVFTQCTGLIVKQVEHLQEMVREFSSFAKLPEVTLVPDRIEPLLREAVSVFSGSHSSIRWTLRIEDVPRVMLDREAMGRAIYNILLNAAEVLADQDDGTSRNRALCAQAQGTGLYRDQRQRPRHQARGAVAHVRALLFDQAQRHGPWPGHRQIHCQRPSRPYPGQTQRTGRHHLCH
jgi:two-component system, NtrC family, nitrogen regulation sensor histidine kinase NtrY